MTSLLEVIEIKWITYLVTLPNELPERLVY